MTQEDYVSFEVAKLLKEKGFDEPFFFYYRTDDEVKNIHHAPVVKPLSYNQKYIDDEVVAAPSHKKACEWFRKKYKIFIEISPISGKGYRAILFDVKDFNDFNYIGETDYFVHPEEADEAGIIYALENLI